MRADTIFKFTTTFDRYTSEVTLLPDGSQSNPKYTLKATGLQGMLLPVSAGNFNLVTRFAMNPGDKISKTQDRHGTRVFEIDGLEFEMFVNSCSPQMDGFGTVIGYSNSLKVNPPKDFFSTLNSLTSAATAKINGA